MKRFVWIFIVAILTCLTNLGASQAYTTSTLGGVWLVEEEGNIDTWRVFIDQFGVVIRYEHSADQVLAYDGAFSADADGNVTGTMNRTLLGATGRFENTDTFSGSFRHWDLMDITRITDWVEYEGQTGQTTVQQTWTRLPGYTVNSIGMVLRAIPAGDVHNGQ